MFVVTMAKYSDDYYVTEEPVRTFARREDAVAWIEGEGTTFSGTSDSWRLTEDKWYYLYEVPHTP